ncbi:hypothetical protein EJB05_14560 [Eragrostis curvula]|uniref:Uncharacterized protein n=1 Tax=Eragrostis curvula TaxID=38414 RepID=A0A5J9VXV1_9POAL|nr:hypothetical protein EJB05_14560 [Eragrostis curvula]
MRSPSQDDGENKTAASSSHSSPATSPPRSLGRDSGTPPESARSPPPAAMRGRRGGSPWMKEGAIEKKASSWRTTGTDAAGSSIADGIALFFFVALILWGASLDQRHHYAQRHVPQVRGGAGQGRKRRWWMEMYTLNATVKLTFWNMGASSAFTSPRGPSRSTTTSSSWPLAMSCVSVSFL